MPPIVPAGPRSVASRRRSFATPPSAEGFDVVADQAAGFGAGVDEDDMRRRRATALRGRARRCRRRGRGPAGREVVADAAREDVEDRLADAVGGGADRVIARASAEPCRGICRRRCASATDEACAAGRSPAGRGGRAATWLARRAAGWARSSGLPWRATSWARTARTITVRARATGTVTGRTWRTTVTTGAVRRGTRGTRALAVGTGRTSPIGGWSTCPVGALTGGGIAQDGHLRHGRDVNRRACARDEGRR